MTTPSTAKTLTSGAIPKADTGNTLIDSIITESAGAIDIAGNVAVDDVNATGTVTATHLTVDTTMLLESASITDSSGTITFNDENLNTSGTISLLSDTNDFIVGEGSDMSVGYTGTVGRIDTSLVAPSDLQIDCGTDKTIVLDESVWDDIQFATSTGQVPSANYPDFDTFTTNTKEYKFDVDDYIDLEANELAHWWKEATTVYPHVHVTLNGANGTGSSRYVKFTIYFAYADANEVWTETTDTVEITIPDGTADLTHLIGSGAGVALTNNKIGSQVKIRLKRIAATAGTEYPNHIFVTQTGIHCEKDTMGSRSITTK